MSHLACALIGLTAVLSVVMQASRNATHAHIATLILRLSGDTIVPFTLAKQQDLLDAAESVVLPALGPIELVGFASFATGNRASYVDLQLRLVIPITSSQRTDPRAGSQAQVAPVVQQWAAAINGTGPPVAMRILFFTSAIADYGAVTSRLRRIVPITSTMEITGRDGGSMDGMRLSLLMATLRSLYVGGLCSSLVMGQYTAISTASSTKAYLSGGGGSGTLELICFAFSCASPDISGSDPCLDHAKGAIQNSTATVQALTAALSPPPPPKQPQGPPPPPPFLSASFNFQPFRALEPPAVLAERPQLLAHTNGSAAAAVPWWLDRINQAAEPLDGNATLSATGTGVNVYLVSSGVRASHQEFLSSNNVSRVLPFWGVNGADPLQDCADVGAGHGSGTYAASLIAGKQAGVARNATIYSVRVQDNCLAYEPAPVVQAVVAALDAVLAGFKAPGVLVIDAWFSQYATGLANGSDIDGALNDRLARAAVANLAVVVPAWTGVSPNMSDAGVGPCNETFAASAATIVVAGADMNFTRSPVSILGGPRSTDGSVDASCIGLWAPGGGWGATIQAADPSADDAFVSLVPGNRGAAFLAAGVVAQMLSAQPSLQPKDVTSALVDMSSAVLLRDDVPSAPNLVLVTDVTSDDSGPPVLIPAATPSAAVGAVPVASPMAARVGSAKTSLTGLSIGAKAGVAVGVFVAVVTAAGLLLFLYARRLRKKTSMKRNSNSFPDKAVERRLSNTNPFLSNMGSSDAQSGSDERHKAANSGSDKTNSGGTSSRASQRRLLASMSDWALEGEDIQLVKTADGKDWELGAGSFGRVVKGVRNDVQDVAVKMLFKMDPKMQQEFQHEIELMRYVSRDANIVQFYGICHIDDTLCLIAEYMSGGDLRQALNNDSSGELGWYRNGRHIALDVTRGLAFLHSKNIVHRDLKSKNILLKDGTAKIGDIGMAKLMTGTCLTADSALGTFAWAAPELLMGDRCTHKVPEQCPQEIADIIEMCMQRDPERRPSAKEVFRMLQSFPEELPVNPHLPRVCSCPPYPAQIPTTGSSEGMRFAGHPAGHTSLPPTLNMAAPSEDAGTTGCADPNAAKAFSGVLPAWLAPPATRVATSLQEEQPQSSGSGGKPPMPAWLQYVSAKAAKTGGAGMPGVR
ncbi:hypothetical protein WJX72_007093 [[Myrmecia] bisecta]|uniref:Protein kinase domain-containing protein n=1 Tax=[Myrmecia] bisecta TaxID=41462 RepID=A0AAW1PK41_9CHLO